MTLPGPNRVNLPSGTNTAVPNSGLQDPKLHSHNQDPGPSSHYQHPVSARPVYYVHAPPPPPFLQYQWPMPISYNPFSGFPGMGYGMVMPPFPPPPYMEAPAYILPHPHIQPVDYRRLLHPQVHAPSAPYQNLNQPHRIRPPHMVPVRETVSSEVQTEPTCRGVGSSSSDSGHGTAANSPSSSTSSQKRGSAYVENYTLPSSKTDLIQDFQVNRTSTCITVKQGINIPHTTGMKTLQSRVRATPETQKSHKECVSEGNDPTCRNSHCNMWSGSSPDNIIPVCSSSQQEVKVVKERRVSSPDILMSWGVGTPQSTALKMADGVQPQDNPQLLASQAELEHEKSLYESPAETQNYTVVAGEPVANDDMQDILSSKNSETKILKLPLALYDLLSHARGDDELEELDGSFRHCLPCRDEPPDDQENGNETNLQADASEVISCEMPMNSSQIKRKMNESVWSVESLAPFIPSKEWMLQNAVFEPDVIVEMIAEAENCRYSTQNDLIVKAGKIRQNYRFSSSDSVPVSDSCLIFSTPAEKSPKKPVMPSEMSAAKKGQSMTPSEKLLLASPTCLQSKIIVPSLTAEGVDENRSSEPEAYQSPNQEYLIVNEQRERSPCSHEQGASPLLSSAAVEESSSRDHLIDQNRLDIAVEDGTYGSEERSRLRNEKLCFPVAEQNAEVSKTQCHQCSSKGHLVDCGVQCTELKELCMGEMEPNRGHPSKYSDVKKSKKGKDEGFSMNTQKNQRRHNQWRNGGSERYSSQQDTVNGYSGRPGKSKGGNVRNPRY